MVEINRGTMPICRSDFLQTSFERKMRAYLTAHAAKQHEKHFGWKTQADKAPGDIEEHKDYIVPLPLLKPAPIHAHLERNIREGVGEHSLQELLNKIER